LKVRIPGDTPRGPGGGALYEALGPIYKDAGKRLNRRFSGPAAAAGGNSACELPACFEWL